MTCTTCGVLLQPVAGAGWLCPDGHEQPMAELNEQAVSAEHPVTPQYTFTVTGTPGFVAVDAQGVALDVVVAMLEKALITGRAFQQRVAYSKRMAAGARLN